MNPVAQEYITVARQLSASECYSKAFDSYLLAFEKCSELRATHEAEFRVILSRLSEVLAIGNKYEDIVYNYVRALKVFPHNIFILNDTGKYLYKYAFYEEAWRHFAKAMQIDPTFVNAEKNLNSLKNLLVERWHFRMLNDKIRNDAFRAAIHQTLIPIKDSVLDIGTGTGLLALYATECNPMIVTACDGSDIMAKMANQITFENGADLMIVLNRISTTMKYLDIPGKRSLIITELFDAGLFGEHVLQTLAHAWDNLIGITGKVLPKKAEFFVIGARSDFLSRRYQLCSCIKALLKVPNLNVHVLTNGETYDSEDVHLYDDDIKYITEPNSLIKVDFNNCNEIKDILNRTEPYGVELKVLESGVMDTVIGYFNLYLSDKVTLTTDPRSPNRANAWQQTVFYDNIPRSVKKNENINLEFLINGGKLTLLPESKAPISRISIETLRFLNDTEYMKLISGCLGMACVYLGQLADMSQISIIDLCPFPMFGLQLMKRGAQSLVCCVKTEDDKKFFNEVFEANNISLAKITYLIGDDWSQDAIRDEKYHAIFCNIFELCGEIDLRFKEIAQDLKQNHLHHGGLFMPANIKVTGQVVNSKWIEINNRLFDENCSDYKISQHLNIYEVSQNFSIDFNHLKYTPLSDPVDLGTTDDEQGTDLYNVPIIKDGKPTAILCWFKIELMEDLTEISTNRMNSFMDGMLFLTNPEVPLSAGHSVAVMRCIDADGSFKLCMQATVEG